MIIEKNWMGLQNRPNQLILLGSKTEILQTATPSNSSYDHGDAVDLKSLAFYNQMVII